MRKDKDTKEFTWWPSFHAGLDRYYRQVGTRATADHPLPASFIKHHPRDGWQLASDSFSEQYMHYVVQPEQRLLHLSESELYQELVRVRQQWVAAGQPTVVQTAQPAPVLEFNVGPKYIGGRPGTTWSFKKHCWVVKPFEQCRSVGDCNRFLRQELEKYEGLRYQRQRRRRGKRQLDFHSDSELSPSSIDATSDEEGLEAQQRRQAQVVKRMEARVRELIQRDRKEAEHTRSASYLAEWGPLWGNLEKELDHRLCQVL